jgi:hypothetical protein
MAGANSVTLILRAGLTMATRWPGCKAGGNRTGILAEVKSDCK